MSFQIPVPLSSVANYAVAVRGAEPALVFQPKNGFLFHRKGQEETKDMECEKAVDFQGESLTDGTS